MGEENLPTTSPGKWEGVPAESSSEEKDSPSAAPGEWAESSSEGKDSPSAAPGEWEGVPADWSSLEAGGSSAPPTKLAESLGMGGKDAPEDSSPEKSCPSVYKGKAVVVESDKELESRAGCDIPILIQKAYAMLQNSDEKEKSFDTPSVVDERPLIAQIKASWDEQKSLEIPLVGNKERFSGAEYETGSSTFQNNNKLFGVHYTAIRRTRGDGSCFFRAFMFGWLEHILETQDVRKVEQMKICFNHCKEHLELYTFDNTLDDYLEKLDSVIQGTNVSISADYILTRTRVDPEISDYIVIFLRYVTAAEIRRRSDLYAPFPKDCDGDVEKFCKMFVLPMDKVSDKIHIRALSNALSVPIRVVFLGSNASNDDALSICDFLPSPAAVSTSEDTQSGDIQPFFTLLLRRGEYCNILYPSK